ncbi:hypothetical protein [Paraburkholderia kirstenboschensis]|uniref:Uncharacterized protein n=1 Tax=Paraburkholderia kirstenboschensis TaxID=1245436 RepID=A0ABZ0E9I8_9BURK|nr:hypothetical protein [Paraburkholderia kirstenboschensis]WOD13876.1 hypothetical protein RW095_08080 [Paraburkholderia kirstenboschensis]
MECLDHVRMKRQRFRLPNGLLECFLERGGPPVTGTRGCHEPRHQKLNVEAHALTSGRYCASVSDPTFSDSEGFSNGEHPKTVVARFDTCPRGHQRVLGQGSVMNDCAMQLRIVPARCQRLAGMRCAPIRL